MFTELEPLLAERTLILTLSAGSGGALRVNVIPKCLKENDAAEKSLSTPLSITGTAAELDCELPAQLANYTQSVLETSSTLRQVREAHQCAVKELEAENKKALDAKRKVTASKVTTQAEDKNRGKEDKKLAETKTPAAPMVSLFGDDPPETMTMAEAAVSETKEG
jgi:PRTRC genetic system protein E